MACSGGKATLPSSSAVSIAICSANTNY
jgi:hypothetical protein